MYRLLLISFFLISLLQYSNAQMRDTMSILEIQAFKIINTDNQSTSNAFTSIDDLSHDIRISFRSNGPSLLSTPLLRGMSGRHTAIVWQGWNILSPVNGVFDLSLLDFHIHQADLNTEPVSDILGNGSAAGALVLEDNLNSYIQTRNNTINNHTLSAGYSNTSDKWQSNIKLSQQWNRNTYKYQLNDLTRTRENNEHQQTDLQLSTNYLIDSSSSINLMLWSQAANREIASSTLASYRGDYQLDDNHRLSVSYDKKTSLGQLHLRGAYFIEKTIFDNDLIVKSIARNQASKAQVLLRNQMGKKWIYSTSYLLNFDRVKASFFDDQIRKRTVHALNHNGTISHNDWDWFYGVRVDLINGTDVLESYHLKAQYNIKRSKIFAAIARAYQLPNFNDLYWPAGGNEDLETERNWTIRTGVSSPIAGFSSSIFKAEAFRTYADDWIIWSPNDQNIWSPDNRRSVISQGFSASIKNPLVSFSKSHKLLFSSAYSFTDTRVTDDEDQSLIGSQLIYIPKHKWHSALNYQYHQFSLLLSANYTSERFIDNQNDQSLEGFLVYDFSVNYSIDFHDSQSITTSISINNLFNQDYQYIRYFPQPLRYTEFACKWMFH